MCVREKRRRAVCVAATWVEVELLVQSRVEAWSAWVAEGGTGLRAPWSAEEVREVVEREWNS
jgi:hypothetical protein